MKFTLFFTLFTFITLSSFGQDSTVVVPEITNKTLDMFYILDDIAIPNQAKTWQPDESPNYLQVTQGESQLTGRIRGRVFFLLGDVDGCKRGIDEEGNSVTSFFVRGREQSTGALMSYEIIEKTDGSTLIHYYNKGGIFEVYFTAHEASKKEIQAIIDYWEGKR